MTPLMKRFDRGSGALIDTVKVDRKSGDSPWAGFPYHLVYVDTSDAVRVLAVAEVRRELSYWTRHADL